MSSVLKSGVLCFKLNQNVPVIHMHQDGRAELGGGRVWVCAWGGEAG